MSEPISQTVIHIPPDVRAHLEKWVRSGYPQETCGLLLGHHGQADERVNVMEVAQARNLNRERARDRYELDPVDWIRADAAARERGLEIVGIWHSHPDHPALPSETDRSAAWEGWSYVIVSVTGEGVADIRSWRLNSSEFHEEAIQS